MLLHSFFFRGLQTISAVALAATLSRNARADVQVEIFQNYLDTGTSIEFSNPVGIFNASRVDFFIGAGGAWHPFGLASFGARVTGALYFAERFNHQNLGLGSSDGSYLWVDGDPLIQNGGVHPMTHVQSSSVDFDPIVAHPFEIQFYKSNNGGASGLELGAFFQHGPFFTFGDEHYSPVPEPGSLLVLLPAMGWLSMRKRRS